MAIVGDYLPGISIPTIELRTDMVNKAGKTINARLIGAVRSQPIPRTKECADHKEKAISLR